MSIIRRKNRDKWVVVDKTPIEDTKLSWQAKGLLTYLLSKPDDWHVHVSQLSNASTNGRDSTRTIVQELVDKGYIIRYQTRNKKGHITGWDYLVSEEAISEKQPLRQNKPKTENPTTGKPTTGKPTTENPTLLNKDLPSNDLPSNEGSTREGETSSPTPAQKKFMELPEELKNSLAQVLCLECLSAEEQHELVNFVEDQLQKEKVAQKRKSRASPKFTPPSIEEVQEYFEQKEVYGHHEPLKFWNHYESNGWMVGKNKMKNWKSAVVGWIARIKDYTPPNKEPTSQEELEKARRVVAGVMAMQNAKSDNDEY